MRSRDWVDYLDDRDRDRARSDPRFYAAIEETAVGQLAHLQAAWAPLRDARDDAVRTILAALGRLGGPFRVW